MVGLNSTNLTKPPYLANSTSLLSSLTNSSSFTNSTNVANSTNPTKDSTPSTSSNQTISANPTNPSNLTNSSNTTASGVGVLVDTKGLSHLYLSLLDVSGFGVGVNIQSLVATYRDVQLTYSSVHDNLNSGVFIGGINRGDLTDAYVGHCESFNHPGERGYGFYVFGVVNGTIERSVAHDNGWNNAHPQAFAMEVSPNDDSDAVVVKLSLPFYLMLLQKHGIVRHGILPDETPPSAVSRLPLTWLVPAKARDFAGA